MKNLYLIFCLLMSLATLASDHEKGFCQENAPTTTASCAPKINESIIQNIADHLIASQFQDLAKNKIVIEYFKSDAYYLATWIKPKDIFKKASKRTYILRINKNLFDCPPPMNALEAIMAHELEHLRDYTKLNSMQLLGLLTKVGLSKKFRTQYERATDLSAMQMGFPQGLIDYRLWIYERLTPKDLKTKKRYYWTPEEIQEWMSHN